MFLLLHVSICKCVQDSYMHGFDRSRKKCEQNNHFFREISINKVMNLPCQKKANFQRQLVVDLRYKMTSNRRSQSPFFRLGIPSHCIDLVVRRFRFIFTSHSCMQRTHTYIQNTKNMKYEIHSIRLAHVHHHSLSLIVSFHFISFLFYVLSKTVGYTII